ncbi:hypothetical protein ACFX2C_017548 [Malus domestica]
MLRRKPTKIELKIEDKDELEKARKQRAAATSITTTTAATTLLHHVDRAKDPSSKTHPLMEVEVKLRLLDAAAHRQVTTLLAPFLVATHRQENLFFDGSKAELAARRAVLRLRFSDRSPLCAVTLKARAVLVQGVSRVEEDEEELDHSIGRACAAEPEKLMKAESRVLRRVREEFGVLGFVGLGGFRNVRDVYDWKGLKLEVDETKYDFGTCYEIECESADPEGVKVVLEDLLRENGVRYSYSEVSKFAIFRAGKLPVTE